MGNEFTRYVKRFGSTYAHLPAAEHAALEDTTGFTVEGAFVDSWETVSAAAIEAICGIYKSHGVREEDVARMASLLIANETYANPVEPLLATAGTQLVPALRAALASPEPRVRLRAVRTLGLLRQPEPFAALIGDPDPQVRQAVVAVWPPNGEKWLAAVASQMDLELVASLRIEMVNRIGNVRTTQAYRILLGSRNDPDGDVRSAAANCLQTMSGATVDPGALAPAACDWLLAESEPGICANLLRYAPLLPHEPRALPLLLALLHDESPRLRALAALGPIAVG